MSNTVKINSILMEAIEDYIENNSEYKSRSDFVNNAIKREFKSIHQDENLSLLNNIREEFYKRGKAGFEQKMADLVFSKTPQGSSKEIDKIRRKDIKLMREYKQDLKKLEKIHSELKEITKKEIVKKETK